MTNIQHQILTNGRWHTLTLCQQLGNVGSEVGRAIHAKTDVEKIAATFRALELLDLTLADQRWHGRGTEIARAREVVCDYLVGDNEFESTDASLEQYFAHFALAARLSY